MNKAQRNSDYTGREDTKGNETSYADPGTKEENNRERRLILLSFVL